MWKCTIIYQNLKFQSFDENRTHNVEQATKEYIHTKFHGLYKYMQEWNYKQHALNHYFFLYCDLDLWHMTFKS